MGTVLSFKTSIVHRNDQIKLEIYTAVHIKLMNLVWKIKPEQKY